MKILLLTCLVASAFAAPAEKAKRDILPGDERYNSLHDHHHHHDHHKNEIEISRALGGYAGTITDPSSDYGVPGLKPGSPLGGTDTSNDAVEILNPDFNSINAKLSSSEGTKQLESVTESSVTSLKDESTSSVKSASKINTDVLSQSEDVSAEKELIKPIEKTKVETKIAGHDDSSESKKDSVKPVSTVDTSSGSANSADTGLVDSSLLTPFQSSFDFSSGAGFGSDSLTPSFHSEFGSSFGTDFDTDFYSSSGRSLVPPFYSFPFDAISSDTVGFDTFNQFNPSLFSSDSLSVDTGKELVKPVDKPKVETKISSDKSSSDSDKSTVESSVVKTTEPGKEVSGDSSAVTTDTKTVSQVQPGLSTSFESKFDSRIGISSGDSLGRSSFGSSFDAAISDSKNVNAFDQTKYGSSLFSSDTLQANAGKGKAESVLETATPSTKISLDLGKSTVESVAIKPELPATITASGNLSPSIPFTSFQPKLLSTYTYLSDSGIGSGLSPPVYSSSPVITNFNAYNQARYNPSVSSIPTYSPGFYDGVNKYDGQFNNNYGSLVNYQGAGFRSYPASFGAYSGFDQGLKNVAIDSSYVPSKPLQFRVGYPIPQAVNPSPFPSVVSVTEANPFQVKYNNEQSYLSPALERQQFSVSTEATPIQGEYFETYRSSASLLPSPTPIPQLIQPDVKISSNAYAGISQKTDANGGYVY